MSAFQQSTQKSMQATSFRDSIQRFSSYQRNIPLLYIFRLFVWLHFFGAVLVPFFTEWGKLNLSDVFMLNAWFMLCVFLLEVPTGTVADYFGRKTSLWIGCVFDVFGALLYVSYPSFWSFFVGEIFFAIAFTLHSGADEALAYDSLKAMKQTDAATRVLSRLEAFKLAGISIGALIGGVIAAYWSLRAPMALYTIPALLAIGIVALLKEPPYLDGGADHSQRRFLTVLKEGARFFAGHSALRWITLEMAFTWLMAISLVWLYQPKLQAIHFALGYFGIVHAANTIGQILFLHNVDRIEQWCGSRKRLLRIAASMTAIAFMLIAWSDSIFVVTVAIVIAFSFSFPRLALYSSEVHKLTPSSERATVLSFTSMCRTLMVVMVHPITGWVSDRSLFAALLMFALLGVALVLLAGYYERKVQPES